MRRTLLGFLLLALSAVTFAQATDPAAALAELTSIRSKAMAEARAANKPMDAAAVNAEILKKAQEMVQGVDPEKIDAKQGMQWAQLFERAQELKKACRSVERFLETNPPANVKFDAMAMMSGYCFNLEEADMVHMTLSMMRPESTAQSSRLASITGWYSELIEQKLGGQKALDLLAQVESKMVFGDPAEEAKTQMVISKKQMEARKAADPSFTPPSDEDLLKNLMMGAQMGQQSAKWAIISRRAELLEQMDKKADAVKALDAFKETLPKDSPLVRQVDGTRLQMTLKGEMSPALTIERGYGDFAGLEKLKGKVVIIDFFAHWCGPCIASFPEMKKLYADLKDQGLEVVGVTTYYGYYKGENRQARDMAKDTEFAKMKEFIDEYQLPWPVVYGPRENFNAYGVTGIPHVAVVGRDGKIHKIKVGYSPSTFAEFRKTIEGLLKETK